MRHLILTGCAGFSLVGLAPADLLSQDLFLGSSTTAITRTNAVTGEQELIGACGGSIHSMALVGTDLYLGTPSGVVYRWNEALGFSEYAFQSAGDARALTARGTELLVGSTDGEVRRYDPMTGTLLGSVSTGFPVHAMCYEYGPGLGDLLVGSISGVVLKGDPLTGNFQHVGTCGGNVTAMVSHDSNIFVADDVSLIWHFEAQNMNLVNAFNVPAPATGIAHLQGDLLLSSQDGLVRRVSMFSGTLKSSCDHGMSLDALAMPETQTPGTVACVGSVCPCDNLDEGNGCGNSNGFGADLVAYGTASVSQDDLGFYAYDLPVNSYALFFMGPQSQFKAWGAGVLCVSSDGYSSTYRFQISKTGAGGTLSLGPGIAALSDASFQKQGLIAPGSTWYFQTLYRDPSGPCFTMNSSPAYGVTFQP